MTVRDRYAPSPTGLQHIGGVRTALFNYLFARARGGTFVLRLEDTDRARSEARYVQNLYNTFAWLGFSWDEGPDRGGPFAPYVQSERFPRYRAHAEDLVARGSAYYCFCSSARLEELRAEREAAVSGGASAETGYDRRCRALGADEARRRAESGEPHTIRLKIPLGDGGNVPLTRFQDHLLGEIAWKNSDINPDPVLLKSDGFPTYHLANVVDDHLMEITHVLRAQEWLPSTPLHVILYAAFGWRPPAYCHLPMVMGQDGKKLSKRHGATSIDEFRLQGYLPEALINYVALLGASYEEGKEFYTLDELAALFSLEKLNKAPAVFDYKKLDWYNGQYIRMKDSAALAALTLPHAVAAGLFGAAGTEPDAEQRGRFEAALPLIKERITFPREAGEKLRYLFSEPPLPTREEFFPKKADRAETARLLAIARAITGDLCRAEEAEAEAIVKARAEREGVKLGDLLMPLRVAVTGARVSPPLFGSLRILGAETALARVDRAHAYLTA
ncbi:MAG: glutamate--tRNA ligase [Spirochaetaceae bacterium]|jgi:glutamyl-tRNA synthetase|nr:glutamate--tRNA ligase [Spirochaetaceae bacterium]